MNIKRITIDGIERFDKVVHISDIHCRLLKRHDEYREIFKKLYKEIEQTPRNTLIVNTGDTHHSKLDITNECFDLIVEFFKKLSDLRPTVVILGNHDLNLANGSRLDVITPIIKAIDSENLLFFKESGLYKVNNLLFNVMSVLNEPIEFIKNNEIPNKIRCETDCLINLYHGVVDGAKSQTGIELHNPSVTLDMFDGADIAMLGDIHKHSILQNYDKKNEKPIVVYASSLIAQDHSEIGEHGYCYWDINSRTFEYKNIDNPHSFYTVVVEDGKIISDLTHCPKQPKLRIISENTNNVDLDKVINELKNSFDIEEITHIKNDTKNDSLIKLKNISSTINVLEEQKNYIRDFLAQKYPDIKKEVVEEIIKIHDLTIKQSGIKDELEYKSWKPKILEFSNMMAYGEDNIIDFTKLNGLVGLFSENASGKSSLLSILSYVLFDKTERTNKAINVLNNNKDEFRCKLLLDIGGENFVIERIGKKDKKGSVKVNVDFYKIENDKIINLNGDARNGTNSIIQKYVGTFEDFILTSLSVQGKDTNFIEFTQANKKDLFSRFLGIDVFDRYLEVASDWNKEKTILLKNLKMIDYESEIKNLKNKIINYEESLKDHNEKLKDNERVIEESELLLSKKIEELPKIKVFNKPISLIEEKKLNLEKKLNYQKEDGITLLNEIKEIDGKLLKIEENLSSIDIISLEEKNKQREKLLGIVTGLNLEIARKKETINSKLELVKQLDSHEYDPNCKYCINNEFVKKAILAKEELSSLKPIIEELIDKRTKAQQAYDECENPIEQIRRYNDLQSQKNNLIASKNAKGSKLLTLKENVQKLKKDIEECDAIIIDYKNNEDSIREYKEKKKIIDSLDSRLKSLKIENKSILSQISNLENHKNNCDFEIKKCEENLLKINKLQDEIELYGIYLKTLSRDGIPYSIISSKLPRIQDEVNQILSNIVDFSIEFVSDDKNIITNIVYGDEKWELELGSGMEKFCASLAIRVALMGISNIPKSNFLAIDEGFSNCDAKHLNQMYRLLSSFKEKFDFILVISHLEAMKDGVDMHLEIFKEDGYSKIKSK